MFFRRGSTVYTFTSLFTCIYKAEPCELSCPVTTSDISLPPKYILCLVSPESNDWRSKSKSDESSNSNTESSEDSEEDSVSEDDSGGENSEEGESNYTISYIHHAHSYYCTNFFQRNYVITTSSYNSTSPVPNQIDPLK